MSEELDSRQVVRLTNEVWNDARGLHCRRSLRTLRRKSTRHLWFDEEISNGGADFAWKHLVNIDECKDGIYTVETCNERMDWETGYLDDYDYRLVPFVEQDGGHKDCGGQCPTCIGLGYLEGEDKP